MKLFDNKGIIPVYHVESKAEQENLKINPKKPSARQLKTTIGAKTMEFLKEIEKEQNHNVYRVLRKIAEEKGMDSIALFYRGNKITYREMFEKADAMAASFLTKGIKPGERIACCMSNTPELLYTFLGANRVGITPDNIRPTFDKEFIKERLSTCSKKMIIINDNNYSEIKTIIKSQKFEEIIMPSLADSLPEHPEECDEYVPELAEYYHYDNLTIKYKKEDNTILSFDEFLKIGDNFVGSIEEIGNLDTFATITYTGGSTRIGRPKPMLHRNRAYILSGLFNATNLTGSPEVEDIRGLALVPPDSNTDLATGIIDNLFKHGQVAMEPVYDKEKFLDCLILNSPIHADATTSFIVAAAKAYFKKTKEYSPEALKRLRRLLVLMAVGEKASPGEEKFANKFLRSIKAGRDIKLNGIRLPFGPLSIGGGDCEHGGIFYTLLKRLQATKSRARIGKDDYGMTPVPYATVTALKYIPSDIQNHQGYWEECNYNEDGIIVANSATVMAGYDNMPEETENKIISDIHGRKWVSCDVRGHINNLGNVVIYGRREDIIELNDQVNILPHIIERVASLDTKNVLSCSVVQVPNPEITGEKHIVVNVEFSPLMQSSVPKAFYGLDKRVKKLLSNYGYEKDVYYRIMTSSNPFPLTASGKRSIQKLKEMGLERAFRINNQGLIKFSNQKDDAIKDQPDNVKQLYLQRAA